MIEIKTKLRKWGNSFGVVVPQRVVKIEKAKEGDEITIFIRREKPHLNPKKNLQYLYCSNGCVDFFGNLKTQNKPHLLRCSKTQGFVIKVFGSLKNWKINPQKFKNDIRREEAEKLLS